MRHPPPHPTIRPTQADHATPGPGRPERRRGHDEHRPERLPRTAVRPAGAGLRHPDRAWAQIAPHALHETNAYGEWLTKVDALWPYTPAEDADALHASGDYLVVTPDECLAMLRETRALNLHPLMGGLDPDLAWESLELLANEVLPRLDDED